jgi:hypothetical protein
MRQRSDTRWIVQIQQQHYQRSILLSIGSRRRQNEIETHTAPITNHLHPHQVSTQRLIQLVDCVCVCVCA